MPWLDVLCGKASTRPIQGFDLKTFAESNSPNSSQHRPHNSSQQHIKRLDSEHLPGLLEVEAMSFECVYGSDHIKVEYHPQHHDQMETVVKTFELATNAATTNSDSNVAQDLKEKQPSGVLKVYTQHFCLMTLFCL